MTAGTVVDTRFLDALASSDPTPGGGSVSAYAGALAAGLISMVCRLTLGQKRFASVQDDMAAALERSEDIRAELTRLTEADMTAYGAFAAAQKLPRATDAEKAERSEKMQAALRDCALVPLRTARACRRLLELCPEVVGKGNPAALSDVGVAALLAQSALRGAALQVATNLAWLKNADFIAEQRRNTAEVLAGTQELTERVVADVERRLES